MSGSDDSWLGRSRRLRKYAAGALRRGRRGQRKHARRTGGAGRPAGQGTVGRDGQGRPRHRLWLLQPGVKELISLEKFKANTRRGAFREGKVESVKCEDDACQVKVMVTYDHPKMKGITTPVIESWIVDGGQAWLVSGAK